MNATVTDPQKTGSSQQTPGEDPNAPPQTEAQKAEAKARMTGIPAAAVPEDKDGAASKLSSSAKPETAKPEAGKDGGFLSGFNLNSLGDILKNIVAWIGDALKGFGINLGIGGKDASAPSTPVASSATAQQTAQKSVPSQSQSPAPGTSPQASPAIAADAVKPASRQDADTPAKVDARDQEDIDMGQANAKKLDAAQVLKDFSNDPTALRLSNQPAPGVDPEQALAYKAVPGMKA